MSEAHCGARNCPEKRLSVLRMRRKALKGKDGWPQCAAALSGSDVRQNDGTPENAPQRRAVPMAVGHRNKKRPALGAIRIPLYPLANANRSKNGSLCKKATSRRNSSYSTGRITGRNSLGVSLAMRVPFFNLMRSTLSFSRSAPTKSMLVK